MVNISYDNARRDDLRTIRHRIYNRRISHTRHKHTERHNNNYVFDDNIFPRITRNKKTNTIVYQPFLSNFPFYTLYYEGSKLYNILYHPAATVWTTHEVPQSILHHFYIKSHNILSVAPNFQLTETNFT